MLKKNNYNIFIFVSVLTRNLIDVFSCILLYKKGYSIRDILLFLIVLSVVGLIIDYFSLKIKYKISLMISSLLYGFCFYYLSLMYPSIINLIIFGIILSISNYSYALIRHLLAIRAGDSNKKDISIILVFMYIANSLSSLLGALLIDKLSLNITSFLIIGLSLLSIIPLYKVDIKNEKVDIEKVSISKDKFMFSVFEQFKIIFVILQPLYLYLYIDSNIYYIGIFNIIVNISSLLVMYFISRKINNKYFKYINLILIFSLLLKLNINNGIILLFIAFFEGIGQKIYEVISLENLYSVSGNNISSYLFKEELIFCVSRIIILFLFYLFSFNLVSMLYVCIVGIFISSFYIK